MKSIKSNSSVTPLKINEIVIDSSLQTRAEIIEDHVREYAERMEANEEFPPVDVFKIGKQLMLVDGFHRFSAAKQCNRKSISAIVHDGSREDALRFALSANA